MADHQDLLTVTVRRTGFADFTAKAKVAVISVGSDSRIGVIHPHNEL